MKYFKKFEGERIYLSPVSVEDAETFACWMNSPICGKNLNIRVKNFNLAKEIEWTQSTDALAIVLKDTDELIGSIELMNINQKDRAAELGVNIGNEKYRGKGYGSEAINLMLEFAFQIMNLHTVKLTVYEFNQVAIRCYQKCGFQIVGKEREAYYYDGEYHNRIMMDIIDREWREKNEK